jgi:hypothetical protein
MSSLFAFLVRLVLVAAGLVLAASMLVAAFVGAALWALHAGWAKLTGRPVRPLVFRMHRAPGFGAAAREGFRTPRRAPVAVGDVTDVEPK